MCASVWMRCCYDKPMNDILVPISPGELLDKITILRIKCARIEDAAKLTNVRLELSRLERSREAWLPADADIAAEEAALQRVLSAAVRTFGEAGRLDRQVDARVRIPQAHIRHRAGQRQIRARHAVLQ